VCDPRFAIRAFRVSSSSLVQSYDTSKKAVEAKSKHVGRTFCRLHSSKISSSADGGKVHLRTGLKYAFILKRVVLTNSRYVQYLYIKGRTCRVHVLFTIHLFRSVAGIDLALCSLVPKSDMRLKCAFTLQVSIVSHR